MDNTKNDNKVCASKRDAIIAKIEEMAEPEVDELISLVEQLSRQQ